MKGPEAAVPRKNNQIILGLCVIGIYLCFLVWGYLQEKLTTTNYHESSSANGAAAGEGGEGAEKPMVAKFKFFIFMNLIQSLIASGCAAASATVKGVDLSLNHVPWKLKLLYLLVGLTSCLASPFGYASLKYINFPTLTLSKSCKLVPVMAVQVLIYRKRYPLYKYLSVALITVGVFSFFMYAPQKDSEFATNSLYGIFLVVTNLLLDGFTNSTEDVIFKEYKVNSTQLMFFLNLSQAFLLGLYLLDPWNPELTSVYAFFTAYPQSFFDLVAFSLAGALGQTIIFFTLEQFGSLTLVTITVTRKLFSMVLSVVSFGHSMAWQQWICVLVVFFGIGMESVLKETTHHVHKHGSHSNGHGHSHSPEKKKN